VVCVICATPLFPMLIICRVGGFFETNHVLATCGLMLILSDVLGRRRVWPALIGLALSFWARQLTFAYWPLVLWMLLGLPPRRRARMTALSVLAAVVILGAYLTLNQLRFGSPFESGYRFIYEGRDDPLARRARRGLFHPAFVPENFYYMMFAPPAVRLTSGGLLKSADPNGSAIWWTCPILLMVIATARQWWADRARRLAMLLSFVVVVALLMYHNTGWRQPGYHRFALDFLPVWLMVIAPYCWGRYRTPLTLLAVAWSVWYFHFITRNFLAWAGIADA
jgi:hypothetical protein